MSSTNIRGSTWRHFAGSLRSPPSPASIPVTWWSTSWARTPRMPSTFCGPVASRCGPSNRSTPDLPTATRWPVPCRLADGEGRGHRGALRHRRGGTRGSASSSSLPERRSVRRWSTAPSHRSPCSATSSRLPECRSHRPRRFPGAKTTTVVGNSNGGLYLIPAPLLPELAPAWEMVGPLVARPPRTPARLDVPRRSGRDGPGPGRGRDRVGVTRRPMEHPDPRSARIPTDPPVPAVIHYHQQIDPEGRIRKTG